MQHYREWADKLLPSFTFTDFTSAAERLGHTKTAKVGTRWLLLSKENVFKGTAEALDRARVGDEMTLLRSEGSERVRVDSLL